MGKIRDVSESDQKVKRKKTYREGLMWSSTASAYAYEVFGDNAISTSEMITCTRAHVGWNMRPTFSYTNRTGG